MRHLVAFRNYGTCMTSSQLALSLIGNALQEECLSDVHLAHLNPFPVTESQGARLSLISLRKEGLGVTISAVPLPHVLHFSLCGNSAGSHTDARAWL